MSRYYHLICLDCKIYLSLGQVYWITAQDERLRDPTFAGVMTRKGNIRHRRDDLFAQVIEKFLILHRNHELRFVPEGVDELLELTHEYISMIDSDDILEQEVDPLPDPYEELKVWEKRIKGSLTDDKPNDG